MKRIIPFLIALAFSSIAFAGAYPSAFPSPLTVTTGGKVPAGLYSSINVTAGAGQTVDIEGSTIAVGIVGNNPCSYKIWNCHFIGPGPTRAIVIWRFYDCDIEHDTFDGTGGTLGCDDAHTAHSFSFSLNRGINISGATGPTSKQYVSFVQLQHVVCANITILWNHLENQSGKSATTDAISLACSGGTAASHARIENNMVHGVYNWPVGPGFNGSGIMLFDPMATQNQTMSAYVDCDSNQVVACENQAYVQASSNWVNCHNNRAVNDGTETKYISVAYQAFNWGSPKPATPAGLFGTNSTFTNNESYWTTELGKPQSNWNIAKPVANVGNTVLVGATDVGEMRIWQAKCEAAKVCVGIEPGQGPP